MFLIHKLFYIAPNKTSVLIHDNYFKIVEDKGGR